MSNPHHAQSHHHASLPLSVLAQSAFARMLATAIVVAALWLAIGWAAALP